MAKKLPATFNCPTEFTLAVLGGKWKTVILCYLKQRPCRYSELRKLLPNLSDKVLTERLHDLLSANLIAHQMDGERSSTGVYSLTERGRSLGGVLQGLYSWGHENAAVFNVEVRLPLNLFDGKKPQAYSMSRPE